MTSIERNETNYICSLAFRNTFLSIVSEHPVREWCFKVSVTITDIHVILSYEGQRWNEMNEGVNRKDTRHSQSGISLVISSDLFMFARNNKYTLTTWKSWYFKYVQKGISCMQSNAQISFKHLSTRPIRFPSKFASTTDCRQQLQFDFEFCQYHCMQAKLLGNSL